MASNHALNNDRRGTMIRRPARRRHITHRRHRPCRAAAGIILLSRLAGTVATSSSPDDKVGSSKEEELSCAEQGGSAAQQPPPALNVLNFDPGMPLPIAPQREIHLLGDGIRSAESSGVFFDSLDRDGDGAINSEEVAMFLQNEIGGTHFDTQIEVDQEVGTIMARLDLNNNDGLEMSDMLEYWNQLDNLLTAEEVADWIVHSVQLPSSVANLFLENGITGYDFLEIVENNGQVLLDELGIGKESFRNKIVRRMQARMLGIGSSPETPQNFTYKLESCKAVTLSWERSTARVFPIHSYRVQRRGVHLIGSGSSKESSTAPISYSSDLSLTNSNSDWKTVYVGGDNEFVDTGLETGHNYMYRIQAWNSVGKSGWESIDLSQALKKQRCSTKPSQPKFVSVSERGIPAHVEIESHWELASIPKRMVWGIVALVQFIYHFMRFFFALFAMVAGLMRYRRATATSSTTASLVLPIPWLWKGLNRISTKLVGQELVPRSMLGDQEALRRQDQLHDKSIMATGLRGYDRSRRKPEFVEEDNTRNDSDRVGKPFGSKTISFSDSTAKKFPPPREVVQSEGKSLNKFSWLSPPNKTLRSNVSSISEASGVSSESKVSSVDMANSSVSRRSSLIANGRACSECLKQFKIGKRYKHHCAQCMATFCHKHGHTTHSNFTSCKIPGDCICNSCLALSSR